MAMKILVLFEEKYKLQPAFINFDRNDKVADMKNKLLEKMPETGHKILREGNKRVVVMTRNKILTEDIILDDLMTVPISYLKVRFESVNPYTITIYFPITQRYFKLNIDLQNDRVSYLMSVVEDKLGISVSLFLLRETRSHRIMYHTNFIREYKIEKCDIVNVEVLHGVSKSYIMGIINGDISATSNNIINFHKNPYLHMYLWRSALFTAAHFNHKELAAAAIRAGVNCCNAVGAHPSRKWCSDNLHVDVFKTPIHQAAAKGSFQCLDMFSRVYPLSFFVKYNKNITPVRIAKLNKQIKCWTLLTVQQFKSARFAIFSYSLHQKILKWCFEAKERVRVHRNGKKSHVLFYSTLKGQFTFDGYNSVTIEMAKLHQGKTTDQPSMDNPFVTSHKRKFLCKRKKIQSNEALRKAQMINCKSYLQTVKTACNINIKNIKTAANTL